MSGRGASCVEAGGIGRDNREADQVPRFGTYHGPDGEPAERNCRQHRDRDGSRTLPNPNPRQCYRRVRLRNRRIEHPVHGQGHVANVTNPILRLLLQAGSQHLPQARRRLLGQGVQVGVDPQHGSQRVGHVFASEGSLSREHLVEHSPECPYVGAFVDGLALGLLGSHIRSGADDHPHLRGRCRERDGGRGGDCRVRGIGLERFRQPKVQHLHRAIGFHLH